MQLYWVLKHGSFLIHRRQKESGGEAFLYLYHVPAEGHDFFVELGVDKERDCFFIVRSFSDSEPLEDYAQYVQLPK